MKLYTALKLGRVSNLPTVWSNVLAGSSIAHVGLNLPQILIIIIAMSLVYIAGMFLNDVFDTDYDRQHRPDRPIPSAEATQSKVIMWAASMLIMSLVLLIINVSISTTGSWYSVLTGLILIILVILYDWKHKANPFSSLIMGLCRGMVYFTAALSLTGQFSWQLAILAISLTVWVVGLTMVAKHKNVFAGFILLNSSIILILLSAPGELFSLAQTLFLSIFSFILVYVAVYGIKSGKYWNSVTLLIAGICLLDALVIYSVTGTFNYLALTATGLFFLTILFQKSIEGS